jgi:hypothetical protein
MSTWYEMGDLNSARERMEQAIRAGLKFDVVLADLGFEGELVRTMSGYTAVSFLETLFDELDVDSTEDEIERTAYYMSVCETWTTGLVVGLFLSPEDRVEVSFPMFLSAMLAGRRLGLTMPMELRRLGIDPMDATKAAATVGAMALKISDDMPAIVADEWEALHARTWLDGLIVARLARTPRERFDEEGAVTT